MVCPHNALIALVQARRGDATLASLLADAASRVTSEAEAQAAALREEARHLRQEAWHDLQSAKSDFEASRHRTMVTRDLELDDGLKAAAVRAASQDLARARQSLRRAADDVEKAVSAARLAESQAEMVTRRVAVCPEVVALEALRNSSGRRHKGEGAVDRKLARVGPATPGEAYANAPHPARGCPQAPGLALHRWHIHRVIRDRGSW
jgi:hypothetical protein